MYINKGKEQLRGTLISSFTSHLHLLHIKDKRAHVYEWFEHLAALRKVTCSNPTRANTAKLSLFTQKWMYTLLSLEKVKSAKEEDWARRLLNAVIRVYKIHYPYGQKTMIHLNHYVFIDIEFPHPKYLASSHLLCLYILFVSDLVHTPEYISHRDEAHSLIIPQYSL